MTIPMSNQIIDGLMELIYVQPATIDQVDQITRVDSVAVQFRQCMDHIGLLANDYYSSNIFVVFNSWSCIWIYDVQRFPSQL